MRNILSIFGTRREEKVCGGENFGRMALMRMESQGRVMGRDKIDILSKSQIKGEGEDLQQKENFAEWLW